MFCMAMNTLTYEKYTISSGLEEGRAKGKAERIRLENELKARKELKKI